jgi:hypothetical protein
MSEQELFETTAKLVDYDPETGSMVWKRREGVPGWWNTRFSGKECGTITAEGYRALNLRDVNGRDRCVLTHRLAWFIVYGTPPKHEIDHLNGKKADNRIGNLRDVTGSINMRNGPIRKTNKSGVTGVYWQKEAGKWCALVRVDGEQKYLGLFDDISEAAAVVKAFRAKHGYTDTHGERT